MASFATTRRALVLSRRAWMITRWHTHTLKRPRPSNIVSFSSASFFDNPNDLTGSSSPAATAAIRSAYDASPNWEDWFSPEEYGSPWEYPHTAGGTYQGGNDNPLTSSSSSSSNNGKTIGKQRSMLLEPLDDDPGLDASSRHLIRQLQILYQDGFNPDEVVSTRRCYHMMGRLFSSAGDIAKSDAYSNKNTKAAALDRENTASSGASLVRQRVMRAVAIFRTMELFWDLVPDVLPDEHPERRIIKHNPNRNAKLTGKWPLPTFEMYVNVLRGLSALRAPKQYETVNNADVPLVCQDTALRLHRLHHTKGMVHLKKPQVEGWNQVLMAWANAHGDRDHPEKALHATQFFMDMKLIYKVKPDASSYACVLRACAHHDQNETAKELGAKLAVRLWTGVMKDEIQLNSFPPSPHIFVFLIRAISHLRDPGEVNHYLQEAWDSACLMGVVNEHVLYELEQSSDQLFKHLIQPYREQVVTSKIRPQGPYDKTYHLELMNLLPDDWKKRDNTTSATAAATTSAATTTTTIAAQENTNEFPAYNDDY